MLTSDNFYLQSIVQKSPYEYRFCNDFRADFWKISAERDAEDLNYTEKF